MRVTMSLLALMILAGCTGQPEEQANRVASSGKLEVALAEVPAPVLAAARAARPGFAPAAAEAETRDGRRYFDVGGRLADGSEIEFDVMEENGRWRVVETQRDIAFAASPPQVQADARAHDAALSPVRVIESVQSDGLVIYELYAADESKLEVKWDGRTAEVLAREWAH